MVRKKLFSKEINWIRFDNVLALSIVDLEFRIPKLFSYQLLFSISFIFLSNGFWFPSVFTWIPSSELNDIPNVEQFKFICAWESFLSGFHSFYCFIASIVFIRSSFFYCLWFSFSFGMGAYWVWRFVIDSPKIEEIMQLNVGGE